MLREKVSGLVISFSGIGNVKNYLKGSGWHEPIQEPKMRVGVLTIDKPRNSVALSVG